MTKYQEALNKIKDSEIEWRISQLDTELRSFERERKYRWHDLMKNPDDVPKDETVVLTYDNYGDYESDKYISLVDGTKQWLYASNEIVAWKEIEPFSGEIKE